MNAGELALFTGIGPKLSHWSLGAGGAELMELGSFTLPANVQYAWPHPTRDLLYVASSNGGQRHGPSGDRHHLTAIAVDRRTGSLSASGDAIALPNRPIHLTIDPSGTHVLVAFSQPGAIRAYGLNDHGSPGREIPQPKAIAPGNYPHQVRVTAGGNLVLSTALGQNPLPAQAEDPGAINVFDYSNGILQARQIVAPDGGYGFGPRHLDIHPNGRWVYVSLERQNRLEMFELDGRSLSPRPRFSQSLLSKPPQPFRQAGGAVHVHPNGRFVYGVNRAWEQEDFEGKPVLAGGENTLAVYEIDRESGAPRLIQHVDTRGIHCRTFHIDPAGKTLAAAHIMGMNVRDGTQVKAVPPGLSIFRISEDGRLHFDRFQPMETQGAWMFWMGIPGFHNRQSAQSDPNINAE